MYLSSDPWDHDISPYIGDVKIPELSRIRQRFTTTEISDLEQHVREHFTSFLEDRDLRGKRIAVTAGSRQISGLVTILKTIVGILKERGADPFVVAAMGSHAGATGEGQRGFLATLGITEEAVGTRIVSQMETVLIGRLESGMPVYCDKAASEADGVIVMNKIKPHADFKGDVESGLCKMMAIGLGKRDGAALFHTMGFGVFATLIPQVAECYLENLNILCGVGIVENSFDRPMICEFIAPQKIISREKDLLVIAKENMARLLMDRIDVLVVDRIGKNISGQGMDPNVTGRTGSTLHKLFNEDLVDRIVVLGLTEETHGNFAGLGMADFSTTDVVKGLDFKATYINEVTSRTIPPARLPFLVKNDRQAIQMGIYTCDAFSSGKIRLVHIRDTAHLEEIEVSPAMLWEMAAGSYSFENGEGPVWTEMEFEDGKLHSRLM